MSHPCAMMAGLLTQGLSGKALIAMRLTLILHTQHTGGQGMIGRRGFLSALAATLGAAKAGTAATGRLVIMSSYPQEMISHYLDGFARQCPGVRADVVWHSGDDAEAYLLGAGRGLVDVYWAASLRNFWSLAQKGAFMPLSIDRSGLPGKVGRQMISDPQHRFEATEVAGYGLLVSPDYLAQHHLPMPRQWEDLTDPAWAGHYVMPVPSRIGFAPTITEILLQSRGWEGGWAVLAALADGAHLQRILHRHAGADQLHQIFVRRDDDRLTPRAALTIDFFASQAMARGAKLQFVYPHENAFEPANIAVSEAAPNKAAALAYVNYVLSAAGQRLLLDPDLRRLPVRPALYRGQAGVFDPFAAGVSNDFDVPLFARRREADNLVFDRWLIAPRARRQALRAKMAALAGRAMEPRVAGALAFADARLGVVPLDAAGALALHRVKTGENPFAARIEADLTAAETVLRGVG